jgi:hypothetical protein
MSPPSDSIIWAVCPVDAAPVSFAAASLKSMCSRKCAKPASFGDSSALPVFTHQ